MSLEAIKGAFINRSRSHTSLLSGQIKIYDFVTLIYPNNKTEIHRSVLFSNYLDSKLEFKKPLRIFMVSFNIPVLVLQSGFFILRRVNCVFGLYDGKDMREDVANTLKLLRAYRVQVVTTAVALGVMGGFLMMLGSWWQFLALIWIGWFGMVTLSALLLRVDNLQSDMEEMVDLDRNHWDVPLPKDLPNGDKKELLTRFDVPQFNEPENEEKRVSPF